MVVSSRFSEALSYVAALHAEQRRKVSGEPYLAHLLAVAAIVMEHGGNEDEAIAALLHDAVEDQGGAATLEEIRRRFGATVAEIVEGCTRRDRKPQAAVAAAEGGAHRPAARGLGLGAIGRGGRQAAQRRFARARVSPPRRVAVGQFSRRPRRHALVLPRRDRRSETGRRHADRRRTRPGRGGVEIVDWRLLIADWQLSINNLQSTISNSHFFLLKLGHDLC